MPTPTFDVDGTSVSLTWPDPPPQLEGEPQRAIAQYAVTATPQDGGPSETFYVPAEEGAELTLSGLDPETTYDIGVSAVIDTEGQGEETFDLGFPPMSITTCKFILFDLI